MPGWFQFLLVLLSSFAFLAFLFFFPSSLFFLEIKRDGIDAVAFPGWHRPVFKDMAQVASAAGTDYLDPVHEIAGVLFEA